MPSPLRNHPLAAARALAGLVRDPYDLPKVFTLIESLPGRAPERLLARTRELPDGRRLLATRPALAPRLADRATLAALPAGTLGRAYAEFVTANGISAEGIVEASQAGRVRGDWPAELVFLEERMRDTHDLWHVVLGYGTDAGGELSVLAFGLAQNFQPGIALICGLPYARRHAAAKALVGEAYRRGKRAAWLPAVVWEDLLDRPLDDVRAQLRVGAPPAYTPITPEDLLAWRRPERAARAAA